jgi:hypothetical protein
MLDKESTQELQMLDRQLAETEARYHILVEKQMVV